jgi:two-component system cell cycle response regulator
MLRHPTMTTRRQPLDILLDLTRHLSEQQALDDALKSTTDAALELVPSDHASLRLFDEDRGQLLSTARSGTGAALPPISFKSGEGVIGLVASTGKAALVEDVATDTRYEHKPGGFPVGSLIAVPLVASGKVVGVLSASSPGAFAFKERDRDLLQLLANCTVPAIESARLAHLAVTDDLTHLYNHRVLLPRLSDEVSRAARYGSPLSVAMLDLDHFKRVNDEHGHACGDEVLRAFVDRVRMEVRQTDVFIRRGGEEFLLIMPSTGHDEAIKVAERIRERVASAPIANAPSKDPILLTVSIGVATWTDGEAPSALEARADSALYRAKNDGRNRVAAARMDVPLPRAGEG